MRTYYLIITLCLIGLSHADGLHAQEGIAKSTLDNCASCHGANGIATHSAWPNLAGQKSTYLARQMRAVRDGSRHSPLMSPPMKGISNAQIDTLAEYYANMPAAQGTPVTRVNQAGKNVRAYCISCHGVRGETVNPTWPNLAGQQKDYLYQQLQKYHKGERIAPLMNVIARELTQEQMLQVAEFYSQQAK
jgi:cytochrome c553